MADTLAERLAAIRERAEQLTASHADEDCDGPDPCTGHDALRLVAAVKAALEMHIASTADPYWCRECGHSFPCWTRRVIERELTGDAS